MGFSKCALAGLALASSFATAVSQDLLDVNCPASDLAIPGGADNYQCVLEIDDAIALHYSLLTDSRLFALTSSAGGYYGIGFPQNPGNMGPAEALISTGNNAAARYTIDNTRSAAGIQQDNNVLQAVTDLATSTVDGLSVMSWADNIATTVSRRATTAQLVEDGSPILDFNVAYSTTATQLNAVHTARTSVSLDLVNGGADVAGGSPLENVQIHARLQVIAWAYLIPIAVLIKRFGPMFTDKKLTFSVINKTYPVPFVIHAVLMTIGIIITIGMVALALEEFAGRTQRSHRATGITVLAGSCFQFVMQFVKCDGDHPQRWVFRWIHMFVGLSTMALAFVTLFTGVDNYQLAYGADFGRDIRIAVIVGLAVFAISYFLMSIVMVCRSQPAKKPKQSNLDEMDSVSA